MLGAKSIPKSLTAYSEANHKYGDLDHVLTSLERRLL